MKKFEEILSTLKFNETLSTLGMNRENGLYYTDESSWKIETSFPNRVKRLIEKTIKPTAFFCFDNKPMILFFVNPSDIQTLHKKIWNFNESPVAIIIENNSVEIFNGFAIDENTKLLQSFGGQEKLNDFSYFELVTGRTWKEYEKELNYKNRVDYLLLQNIKAARHKLVGDDGTRAKLINAILGKVIFVRYLIDRKVNMKFDGNEGIWDNNDFCNLFDYPNKIRQFFEYLEDKEKGFNGDLFPLTASDYEQIGINDYQVVKNMLLGVNIQTNQVSLFQLYDFSIIPIEFISNVYELFIGQDNQRKEGAYYTPLFLVDYILNETVEEKLSKQEGNYNCRVLDPACGSGIFLVETLRKIIEKYISVKRIKINTDEFKEDIKKLAQENIYGVDKDLSAVQVAIFSIYLTLLDYLEPPGIETFKFPVLFNKNFFVSDFFDENAEFNTKLKDIEFDFILGNPPWKGNGMDNTGKSYLKNREKRENELGKKYKIAINNSEIAEGFVLRVSDFCKTQTKIALIIGSSSLYNLGYEKGHNKENLSYFRQYFLEEYFIDKVFELAPVRYEVFEKSNKSAVKPAAVIFYRFANAENTDNNIVQHIALKKSRFFSLFKIFTINRNDYKQIQQKKLKEFDWLWKLLVYGSYLDFNLVKRLKEEFSTIKNVVYDKNKFVTATGFHSRTNPLDVPKDTSLIDNLNFIKTEAIGSFIIDYEQTDILEKEKIDIIKDTRIYYAPMLLIRKGLDMNTLTAKCSISKRNIIFKDGITSIKTLDNNNSALFNIAAIFSSNLFSYYAINTFASIGIEREQAQNYNKFSLPYLELDAYDNIKKIEHTKQRIYSENKETLVGNYNYKILNLENIINTEQEKINISIYKKLNIDDIELSLVNYALEINRTLIVGDNISKNKLYIPIEFEDDYLQSYAQLFIDRFQKNISTKDRKFIVVIQHTKQIVGMLFKVIPTKEYKQDIVWENKQGSDSEIFSFLTKLSSEKITDRLFVQKDVRGFDKDSFYIFKPNEKRLWHKAIGYLDVNEFADAILEAGRKSE